MHVFRPSRERQIALCQPLDCVFVEPSELRVGPSSFLAGRIVCPDPFNLLPMKKIVQVHLSSLALLCRPCRLDHGSLGPAFSRPLHDVNPSIRSAHEGCQLFEMLRSLA
jgi:hypothetical protein